FFFFQAEDGIRDFHVTGVQTCALPISRRRGPGARPPADERLVAGVAVPQDQQRDRRVAFRDLERRQTEHERLGLRRRGRRRRLEIGRASCRERVWRGGGGGGVKNKKQK